MSLNKNFEYFLNNCLYEQLLNVENNKIMILRSIASPNNIRGLTFSSKLLNAFTKSQTVSKRTKVTLLKWLTDVIIKVNELKFYDVPNRSEYERLFKKIIKKPSHINSPETKKLICPYIREYSSYYSDTLEDSSILKKSIDQYCYPVSPLDENGNININNLKTCNSIKHFFSNQLHHLKFNYSDNFQDKIKYDLRMYYAYGKRFPRKNKKLSRDTHKRIFTYSLFIEIDQLIEYCFKDYLIPKNETLKIVDDIYQALKNKIPLPDCSDQLGDYYNDYRKSISK